MGEVLILVLFSSVTQGPGKTFGTSAALGFPIYLTCTVCLCQMAERRRVRRGLVVYMTVSRQRGLRRFLAIDDLLPVRRRFCHRLRNRGDKIGVFFSILMLIKNNHSIAYTDMWVFVPH